MLEQCYRHKQNAMRSRLVAYLTQQTSALCLSRRHDTSDILVQPGLHWIILCCLDQSRNCVVDIPCMCAERVWLAKNKERREASEEKDFYLVAVTTDDDED